MNFYQTNASLQEFNLSQKFVGVCMGWHTHFTPEGTLLKYDCSSVLSFPKFNNISFNAKQLM